jgi:hypothetical protein
MFSQLVSRSGADAASKFGRVADVGVAAHPPSEAAATKINALENPGIANP